MPIVLQVIGHKTKYWTDENLDLRMELDKKSWITSVIKVNLAGDMNVTVCIELGYMALK